MSQFWVYVQLGFEHVLDWNAYDHVLFIAAFSVLYSLPSWKKLLALVTAFTLGHTFSMFWVHFEMPTPAAIWVEFLIPVTIIFAGLKNVWTLKKGVHSHSIWQYAIIVLFFGIIHGFGFGREFSAMNINDEIAPLLAFAVGIEASQLLVVTLITVVGYLLTQLIKLPHAYWVAIISSLVIVLSIPILIDNWPEALYLF